MLVIISMRGVIQALVQRGYFMPQRLIRLYRGILRQGLLSLN